MRNELSGDRGTALAITALTGSVFVGTQVLARLSTSSPGVLEAFIGVAVTVALAYVLSATNRHERDPRSRPARGTQIGRGIKPLLIGASLVFALIPRIEVGSFAMLSLGLRVSIGLAIALVVRTQSNRWLLAMSVLTIVLHRWAHPRSVTIIFVGLILVGFALCTRSELSTDPRVTAATRDTAPSGAAKLASPGIRAITGTGYPAMIIGAVVVSLLGAAFLGSQAQRLSWRPDRPGSLGSSGGLGSDDSPRQRFTALKAQDELDLSYNPTRSTQKIMTLYTDVAAPVFLRAQTFDLWTGRTWKNSGPIGYDERLQAGSWLVRPSFRDSIRNFRQRTFDPQGNPEQPETERTTERMVIETEVRFTGYIPVPVEPVAIITDLDTPAARWRSDGTVTPSGDGPNIYVVLHDRQTETAVDLSRSDLLSLEGVSDRTKRLALEITRDAATPEAKAAAISKWVTANVTYNLAAEAPGRNVNVIDDIVFTSRTGTCTQFATVTTALLRSVGIPARVATGFVGQTRKLPSQIEVQAKDAHAWAEVPQDDGQWLIFDTTLGSVEVITPARSTDWKAWMAAAAALAAGLVAITVWRRRTDTTRVTPNQVLWNDLLAIGTTVGLTPSRPVSYRRFAEDLDETLEMHGELSALGKRLDRRAFGPTHAEASELTPFEQSTVLAGRRKAAQLAADRKRQAKVQRRARWRTRARPRTRRADRTTNRRSRSRSR